MNWRQIGDVSFSVWRDTLAAVNSPLMDEATTTYAAASGHSRLALAMMAVESRYGTAYRLNTPLNRNVLNLRPRGGSGYQAFASWADGIREWKARLLDPNYAYRDTVTVADLIAIYAPASDNNDPRAYAARVTEMVKTWPGLYGGTMAGTNATTDKRGTIIFGLVPHPPYHLRPISKPNGFGMDNLGQRTPKGVVWHRMLGGLASTETYFRMPTTDALTDYGIGVGGYDAKALNGVIYRWNDPHGFQSGWASGKVIAPYGDGAAFVRKYGLNAVNRDQVSVEVAGQYDTPLTEEVREAIAAITAYYADQYGIPWDEFPIAAVDGFSFVRWHQEFTGPQEKPCPGSVIIRETPALIERTRAIMRRYQEVGAQPDVPGTDQYARPVTYEWLAPEEAARGLDRRINRTNVYYAPQVYTVVNETPRYQGAKVGAKEVGPPIEPGVRFRADYVMRSNDVSWVITPAGTRVLARDLLPKIQITKSGTVSVRRTADGPPEIIRPTAA